MKKHFGNFQKGQSLVIVAIFLIALIAILALTLDGGNAYLRRREAQNAADAGALAGARDYCEYKDVLRAQGIAENYVAQNNAELFEPVSISTSQGKVNVKTQINFQTFFGSVIGIPDITAVAEAEAGCQQPCLGLGVLPVVWICNPDGVVAPGEMDCENLAIKHSTLMKYLKNPPDPKYECDPVLLRGGETGYVCPELTIVMDNIDIDEYQCETSGGVIDCDFDDDGEDDYVSANNRGWVDLDGDSGTYDCQPPTNEGANELIYWIENGYQCEFWPHTWVGDQSGNTLSIYHAVEQRRQDNPYVILPVFDDSCPTNPDPNSADYTGECNWHSGEHPPGDVVHVFSAKENYYHIDHFSVFYITCVQTINGDCPGATQFFDQNRDAIISQLHEGADYNAIEGYFLRGALPGLTGGCGYDPDMDVFSVYLVK